MSVSLEVKNITVSFGETTIIDKMNFSLNGTGLTQILGPNGAGKTTLLRTILGLIKPVQGKVVINGIDTTGSPEKAGKFIGYVPQLFMIEKDLFPITSWEIVENSLLIHKKKWPRLFSSSLDSKIIEEALEQVGLERNSWFKSFWKLSGGQKQRVLLARALVHNPQILVLDEPLASVDPLGKAELAELIGRLSREKLVIVTSHDPMLLLKYTRIVILMNRTMYIVGKPEEVLTLENTRKIYGGAVLYVKEHVHISDTHIF